MSQLILADQYLTGIESVDEQHSKLVEMLNALNSIIEEKQDEAEVLRIVDQFLAYTKYHFADEERMMEDHDYPALGEHCQIHMNFIDVVSETVEKYNGTKFLRYKFSQIGMDILMNHIEKEDHKFAQFLREKENR